jgi:ribose-phosphate pyrophosphokinase
MVTSGTSHPALANEICARLGDPPGQIEISKFGNDNTFVRILDNVREADVFVVQTSCPPVNDHFMELLIIIDALRRASASRITAVLPYFPYVRSDKKDAPRIPITARLVADLLIAAGAGRILTMDLHAPQIQGFFNIPTDQLEALPLLCDAIVGLQLDNLMVVASDVGRANFARDYAHRLGADLAMGDKRRQGDRVEVFDIIGNVSGKQVVIVEDEVATGSTIAAVARLLKDRGATAIYVAATHGVFTPQAPKILEDAGLAGVIVTNTVPQNPACTPSCAHAVSVGGLFAEAIKRIHGGESISELFT